ncbi:unnamed protein product [Boreogadus saida]
MRPLVSIRTELAPWWRRLNRTLPAEQGSPLAAPCSARLHPALHSDTVTREQVDHLRPKEEELGLAARRSLLLSQNFT